ncbi:ribonuclease domain-containing protein [Butyrivibrio sp. YAB3001]|uniref:ribonuclease domain-containing protein n=1 Tax=Butyrivibrio sp. YAB3001 TaxID=1520812 RepID=UPI0008F68C1B|nr:ribonuclease domain-containing protein [Butyrivibrio sp. YAB3001]SFB87812.1 ribonuclease [Butyrivibrio sp. YAB3001]
MSENKKMKYLLLRVMLAALITVGTLGGCGKKQQIPAKEYVNVPAASMESSSASSTTETEPVTSIEASSAVNIDEPEAESSTDSSENSSEAEKSVPSDEASTDFTTVFNEEEYTVSEDKSYVEEPTIDEYGTYTTKDDVALYIHIYGKLPSNFITKKEAKKLGWSGGSLEEYAPGKSIGGDYFGNYEGLLPKKKGREYHECDIDTRGKKKRGAKRIIYSNDELIYYTPDHYESFELLYGEP